MALLDLTNVKSTLNDVKKNLYLDEDLTIKFLNTSKVILEVSSGWYIDKNPQKELSSPEFYQISIVDSDINLDKIIPRTTSIKIGDVEYASFEYTRPRTATKEWLIKVQTAQMMRRDV